MSSENDRLKEDFNLTLMVKKCTIVIDLLCKLITIKSIK